MTAVLLNKKTEMETKWSWMGYM